MVSMDSFAAHAAYYLGIPTIMLAGATPGTLWKTPLTEEVQGSKDCPFWPCLYKKKCKNHYTCFQDIAVEDVFQKIEIHCE